MFQSAEAYIIAKTMKEITLILSMISSDCVLYVFTESVVFCARVCVYMW